VVGGWASTGRQCGMFVRPKVWQKPFQKILQA